MQIDETDRKILAILQQDCTISVSELSKRVHLSSTPCWRRVQKLEKAGVISSRVALLDPAKLGLGVSVFVQLRTSNHDKAWLDEFAALVSGFDEVVEFYRMAGEYDYLMRVVVADIPAFDRFYKDLISRVKLSDVTSSFSMEQIKYTTALPIG